MTATICLGCNEAVSNPLCASCISKEIKAWLSYKDKRTALKLNNAVNDFKQMMGEGTNTRCVLCSKMLEGCTYCFTEHIYYWLKEQNSLLVEEFMRYFSFDLKRKGFTVDAVKNRFVEY